MELNSFDILSAKELRRVAFHEAGHAVMHLALGNEFKEVEIEGDVELNGAVRGGRTGRSLPEIERQTAELQISWIKQMMAAGEIKPDDAEAALRTAKKKLDDPEFLEPHRALENLWFTLAGPVADQLYLGQSRLVLRSQHNSGDFDQARTFARYVWPESHRIRHRLIQREARRVRKFLEQPRVWRAVERLAEALLQERRISFERAARMSEKDLAEAERPELRVP